MATGVSMMMPKAFVAVCAVGEVESFTCTVKLDVPAVVGVPEITPVEAAKVSPTGSDPELIVQVYGDVPPLAPSVALYAVP